MRLGREICGRWTDAVDREWLVTNGIGGFACGTLAGANTRRYHGFLMASFRPPVERTLLVAKVDISVNYLGLSYALCANEYDGDVVDPQGFAHLESFEVRFGIPIWRYAIADALVEQRVFMAPGENTSFLRLQLLRASAPLRVELKPLVTYRDYHSHSRGLRPFRSNGGGSAAAASCTIMAFDDARPIRLSASAGTFSPGDTWYWNFLHREERARGLDALEDLWLPGQFGADIGPGEAFVFAASTGQADLARADTILAGLTDKSRALVSMLPETAPPWVHTLAAASDQFIVQRTRTVVASEATASAPAQAPAATVIAGYPWFTDWGRDTMISLPGLTTVLGRFDTTAAILRTYVEFVDAGMLPNRFPDGGESLEYNTGDATLWMFQALNEHLIARRDPDLVRDIFPTLVNIIHAHVEGTRYGIKVDPDDGLLAAGVPGVQLTWMDAKHGERVFTPRVGKPVEINALWLNALDVMVRLLGGVRDREEKRFCEALLQKAGRGFDRFWNQEGRCLFDVLDVDGGATSDASVRPNQIFAVSLPYSVLTPERMRAVVDICGRELLTSHGLRSLSPADPAYVGIYGGDSWQRDSCYHNGTVWSWLLGPFARAHYRVYGDAGLAQSFLAPIAQHLTAACVGSVSEIFDGDAPHTARGCFAQAWSVAEILRSWVSLERTKSLS